MARTKQTARRSVPDPELLRQTYRQQQNRHPVIARRRGRPPRAATQAAVAGSSRGPGRPGRPRGQTSAQVVTIDSSNSESESYSESDSESDEEAEASPESFKSLYPLREQWGDVCFQLSNGKKVKASKVVLVRNCKHFETMLGSGFSESNESTIQITDTAHEPFEYLIKYCYYGNELFDGLESDMAKLIAEKMSELTFVFQFMKLADKYNLQDVVNKVGELVTYFLDRQPTNIAVYTLVQALKADCIGDSWISTVANNFRVCFQDMERCAHQIDEWKKIIRVNTTAHEYTTLYTSILEKALQIPTAD